MSQALSQPLTQLSQMTPHMSRRSPWSADLSWPQRALLIAVVVVLHGLVWWLVLQAPVKPIALREPMVIAAQLLPDAPRLLPPPPPPAHAEPLRSHHEGLAPMPVHEPVAQRRQVVDAPPPPPVLASPKAAPVNEPAVPVSENRAMTPSSLTTAPTAVRAPKDVAGEAPAGSEHGRNDPKDHTISPADYLIKPPNDYPADAYDAGESGTVKFEVLIDENGRPEDFKIQRSSGSPRLDRQARRNVMRARFKPRTENGQPWKGWLHGQMTFTAPD